MVHRSVWIKTVALVLSIATIVVTLPFSSAATVVSLLGTITTRENVTVGNVTAPTGTTIFAGDRVISHQPALINFGSGSRIEMTKAIATFARQGKTLVVRIRQGLFRFNFQNGEDVQIDAGEYIFTTADNSRHIGELGLNHSGHIVMQMEKGSFAAMSTITGVRTEVAPHQPLFVLNQSGQGLLTKGGTNLEDASKIYQRNELKGMCAVSGSEAYRILGNTATVIKIDGSWKLNNGTYNYKVVECTMEAMTAAGASQEAAGAAASKGATGGTASGNGSRFPLKAIVIAGVSAVGVGIGVSQATKSSSSR